MDTGNFGTHDDEVRLIEGVIEDHFDFHGSYAKNIDHVTGKVLTMLEMIGRHSTREEAREIALEAIKAVANRNKSAT